MNQQHKGRIDGYTVELFMGEDVAEGRVSWQTYSESLQQLLMRQYLRDAAGDEHFVEDESLIAIKKWAKSKGFPL